MSRPRAIVVLSAAIGALLVARTGAAPVPLDEAVITHVLNRTGYGPRPGDLDRIRQTGVQAYINAQLHPERIPDVAMARRLSGLTTIGLSSAQIAARYARPALEAIARQASGALGTDAASAQRAAQQRATLPMAELTQQKLLRAVYSERQLVEVLTDFWFNHFNVDARKGPVRFMLTEYERDTIRPHVLGRFRDLLAATAKSPAMLFYLDNWLSIDPNGPHLDRARGRRFGGRWFGRLFGRRGVFDRSALATRRPGRSRGLNENYAREILELHTLGADGGYTQNDVTEVARAFTGWSIDRPREGGGFRFLPAFHDEGQKIVLGRRIEAGGGPRDGERVLDILATHPSTARFIVTKLARRFVSDAPPRPLVDRAAETFGKTHGDLRAVMGVILNSPEFLSPDAQRAKVKTPFEFIVSALRATGAEVVDASGLVGSLRRLDMPPYEYPAPTGYMDTEDVWVNAGAIVSRMNEALALTSGAVRGVRVANAPPFETLVGGALSDVTRSTIAGARSGPEALALAIGSPEFQRR